MNSSAYCESELWLIGTLFDPSSINECTVRYDYDILKDILIFKFDFQ